MAALGEDVFFSTVQELRQRLDAREFSVTQLTTAFCDRLERHGPRLNALALSLRDLALAAAHEADNKLKRGRGRGALFGIPFAVKDLLSVGGRPTTWGAKPYASQVFKDDATAVARLKKAGAIPIAKLAMVELAGGGGYRYAAASLTGPGLNPWDRTRWSGGSSSGSGAGVAAGLVPFALGSETNGSIVTPCAFCGVTGLRPTYGLVSRAGAMALSWTLDKIGPLARSAADCGAILQALAGRDDRDPGSARKSFYFGPQFAPALKDLRVGYARVDFEEWAGAPLRPALGEALRALQALGCPFQEAELPEMPYGALVSTIIAAEGASVFSELIQSGKVEELADQRQIAGLKAGLETGAHEYLRAMRLRSVARERLRELFMKYDVLVSPARTGVAGPVHEPLDRPSGGRGAPARRGLRDLISAGNLAGLPALVLPCGFAEGMPVALQLVGRPFSENTLLALGIRFQTATDWHRRRPPS